MRRISTVLTTIFTGVLVTAQPRATATAAVGYSWGYNVHGELGNGTTVHPQSTPGPMSALPGDVTALEAGNYFSMALINQGVYVWGDNFYGQLGNGTTAPSVTPAVVAGLSSGVTAIDGGYEGTALAIQNGALYAWGSNGHGKLGDGSTTHRAVPGPVSGMSSGVTAASGGTEHSVAIKDGVVYAWGWNANGQLGDGTNVDHLTPAPVSGLPVGVTDLAVGYHHNLALKDGTVYSWGFNSFGQVGDGSGATQYTPVALSSLPSGVDEIAAGGYHSLALVDGQVYAWGSNQYGQMGDGGGTHQFTPALVPGLTDIVDVAACTFASYAIGADGSLWTWGYNASGQLGLGTAGGAIRTPQQILPPDGYRYTSLAGGTSHMLALLTPVPEPGAATVLLGVASIPSLARRRRQR